jgi:hypothetical protein
LSFSEELIQLVWEKGQVVPNNNPDTWRKDECGAWIKRNQHGNRESQYGWEIDHIGPDGGDDVQNLRPLQWENNVATSDSGQLSCVVQAQGVNNVRI